VTVIVEGKLRYTFAKGWIVTQYDRWRFYERFKTACGGNKGVDLLALSPSGTTLYLIQLKDYRSKPRTKDLPIWNEFALKVRDTLAGLYAAAINGESDEKHFAQRCLGATTLSAVLHLERAAHPSRLFAALPERADMVAKLKKTLRKIDAHPRVIEIDAPLSGAPWSVESLAAV